MREHFENFENLDKQVETLVKQGHSPAVATKAVYKNAIKNVGAAATGKSIIGIAAANGGSDAEFDITITRLTSAVLSGGVAAVLPVPIFGAADFQSAYNQVLNTLPVGVSISGIALVAGNCQITYTDGTHSDIVVISCSQYPYASFLYSMYTNLFRIGAIRYTVFDTTQLTQYNNQFQIIKRGMFGTDKRDKINVLSYKKPEQFQNGIVDIGTVGNMLPDARMVNIDQETTLVIGCNASAGFSFNLSMFLSAYSKHNAG
jgi:hypothetical protein